MKRAVLLCVLLGACGAEEHATGNRPPPPPDTVGGVLDTAVHLEAVKNGGDFQQGIAGKQLALPLVVRVMNGSRPIQGMFVEWHADYPGGSVDSVLAKSDLNGVATTRYSAGTKAAIQTVHATLNRKSVYFNLVILHDDPHEFRAVRGDGDSATTFLVLMVGVTDQYGNAVPDIPVNWQILSGDVAFDIMSDTTDTRGTSFSFLHFGSTKGPATVSAAAFPFPPVIFNVKSY
ncbi:MAG TPA: Ig-like domain-containing protein [Gemmatimonadales bacterium]|nr:Ig-like domain-containing protein [Gemmatimonadales bacterium]